MLAIIGGSGLTQLSNLDVTRRLAVRTPYGEPSGALTFGRIAGEDVVFLARHGYGHTIAPHQVNYRANIWALLEQKVEGVVSVASVGGIRTDMRPGAIAVPHQIIDYTSGRKNTFFEGGEQPVTHIDFTEPYSAQLRRRILDAARACGEAVVADAIYAASQGPRLETAAEIDRLERDGADVVGMTGMPEAVLAREVGLDYATIAVVVNSAAGRADSLHGIRLEDIEQVLQQSLARVRRIIEQLVLRA
ncbi:MAG: 5'-methylthioadenosine phosphorylase [Betaproteobacteria bacterium RIFCSPLOWO2_12_FULL_64_23]|nr:MAG: 5'-methylthioadenosine phosphorylase [Betaproteobacteria bacterium RIFCSPLOWO2_12_FULL_64_23]